MAFAASDDAVVVIPARMASTRFPAKPLARLRGSDGQVRPLIEHSWRAATAAAGDARVIVATDDEQIAQTVRSFGGEAAMTSGSARNGSERVWEAVQSLEQPPQLIVNWQGDAPLIPPSFLEALATSWRNRPCPVLTPAMPCDAHHASLLLRDWRNGVVGGTCAVADRHGNAHYFSKSPLPSRPTDQAPIRLHVGLYAYTASALEAYCAAIASPLEEAEGLEQLRFLDIGIPIRLVDVAVPPGGLWEVNNPEDVAQVEAVMAIRRG